MMLYCQLRVWQVSRVKLPRIFRRLSVARNCRNEEKTAVSVNFLHNFEMEKSVANKRWREKGAFTCSLDIKQFQMRLEW